MLAYASEGSVFLIKKLGGLLLLVPGTLLTARGSVEDVTWPAVLGVFLVAGGVFPPALKAIRRNRTSLP